MRCPDCHGSRTVSAFVDFDDPSKRRLMLLACSRCQGEGTVSDQQAAWLRIGDRHRTERVGRDESLMECARRLGMSARELSDMEHGRVNPSRLSTDDPATSANVRL
jgi:hypothetical protein